MWVIESRLNRKAVPGLDGLTLEYYEGIRNRLGNPHVDPDG